MMVMMMMVMMMMMMMEMMMMMSSNHSRLIKYLLFVKAPFPTLGGNKLSMLTHNIHTNP